jgi:DNA-binding protein HU-beta
MKKSEMIEKVAERFSMTKAQAERVINFYAEVVETELMNDGESIVHGVGSLKVKTRAARTARNPQTGAAINVPEKKAVTFRATSSLKAKVQ